MLTDSKRVTLIQPVHVRYTSSPDILVDRSGYIKDIEPVYIIVFCSIIKHVAEFLDSACIELRLHK